MQSCYIQVNIFAYSSYIREKTVLKSASVILKDSINHRLVNMILSVDNIFAPTVGLLAHFRFLFLARLNTFFCNWQVCG